MVRTPWIRICVALTLLISTIASYAQITTAQLLNGEGPASKLAIKDLPDAYRGVELKFAGAASGVFETMFGGMLGMFSSLAQGNDNSMPTQLVTLMSMSFTSGEHVEVEGVKYLVTYRLVVDEAKPASIESGPPVPQVVSWQLTLVNPATIQQMSPHAEWTAASAKDAIKKAMAQAAEMKAKAESTVTQSNIKQVCTALIMYQADNDDVLPPAVNVAQMRSLLGPYVQNKDSFLSHAEGRPAFEFNYALSGVSSEKISNPAEVPTVYESAPWPDGKRWIGYLDGHVARVNPYEFAKLKAFFDAKYPRAAELFSKDFVPGPDPLGSQAVPPQEAPGVGNKSR